MTLPEWHGLMGILAGIATITAYIPNTRAILRNTNQLQLSTWIVWMISSILLLASCHALNVPVWMPLGFLGGNVVTLTLLLIKKAPVRWSRLDSICVTIAILSVIPWLFFSLPVITITILLAMDFMGAVPTARKVYYEPWTEDKLSWAIWGMGFVLNMLAVSELSYTQLAYPTTMLFGGGSIALFTLWTRGKKRPNAN